MTGNNKILYSILILLVFLQAGLFCLVFFANKEIKEKIDYNLDTAKDITYLAEHYSYFSSLDFFEESFEKIANNHFDSNKKVYGGIIPHHLVVKDNLASFFLGLKDEQYDNIILIGPNHFEKGNANIISSKASWQTPYGELMPNLDLIDDLNLEINEEPFIEEHSISGLVSFIKKTQSKAKFVPLILKVGTSEEECMELAKKINNNTDSEKTLVLASVDFSHYLPVTVADFHDRASQNIIETFDFDRIYNMEIDSPASIYTLLRYLESNNAQGIKLLAHTNSGRMINNFDEPTTSHNFYYFSKAEVKKNKNISMMFFGDLMIDRYVKELVDKKGIDYIFLEIKADENRFFRGVDIIGANLEGAVMENGEHFPPEMSFDFSFDPKDIKQLKNYNFNLFNLANNHFSDQGKRGIIETRENLDKLGIFYVGAEDKQLNDYSTKIIELKNMSLGLAGFSSVYGLFDIELAKEQMRDLERKTDLQVVNIHWGQEYDHYFNKTQEEIAHALIDAGADIIIGHHPHVIQGFEIYQGSPIFYSLGNFVFDQYFSRDTQSSLAVAINYSEEEFVINLFPIFSRNMQVSLMKEDEKKLELENIIKWSQLDDEIKTQIETGTINLRTKK